MNNTYIWTVFVAVSIFIQILLLLAIRFTVIGEWPFGKDASKKDKVAWIEIAVMLQAMGIGVFFPSTFWFTEIPFLIAFFLLWYTIFEKTFIPIKLLNPE